MPTKAVTGTQQMHTTGGDMPTKSAAKKAAKKAEPEGSVNDSTDGHHRRRNWTGGDGVRHTEELRPGSKAWVEVETD